MKDIKRHFTLEQASKKGARTLKCTYGIHLNPHKKARNPKEFLAKRGRLEAKQASMFTTSVDPEEEVYFAKAN